MTHEYDSDRLPENGRDYLRVPPEDPALYEEFKDGSHGLIVYYDGGQEMVHVLAPYRIDEEGRRQEQDIHNIDLGVKRDLHSLGALPTGLYFENLPAYQAYKEGSIG